MEFQKDELNEILNIFQQESTEIIASMEKSNIPKNISIPVSVIFRYIPSVIEEIKSITNAMKMRLDLLMKRYRMRVNI